MLNSLVLAAALWPAEVTQYCPPPNDALIVGIAKNNSGNFLYCEWFSRTTEKNYRVSYTFNSTIFAVKDLDFSENLFVPQVTQFDSRSNELREAKISNATVLLKYQENKDATSEITTIPLNKVDVLDAGFNNFIHGNWDQLISGKEIPVNFGSIAHQKTLPLLISAKPAIKCSNLFHNTSTSYPFCFVVEINNVFLRLLIGNIKLNYDQQRRLQEFNGAVNILDDKQKTQNAIIRYYYNNDYLITPSFK